jgi:hypothetical protein
MSKETVAIVAALIGAVIGSLGAQIVADRLLRMRERRQRARDLVRLHLIQLEDAAESLFRRLDNVKSGGGKELMGDEYYLTSMLYALGSFLAHKRIFLLEGHYAVLDELHRSQGTELQGYLEAVERKLDPHAMGPFFRYDRLALAESVMRWSDGDVRICSSLDFRSAYAGQQRQSIRIARRYLRDTRKPQQQPFIRSALQPAEDFLRDSLGESEIDGLMEELDTVKGHLGDVRRRLRGRDLLGSFRR